MTFPMASCLWRGLTQQALVRGRLLALGGWG